MYMCVKYQHKQESERLRYAAYLEARYYSVNLVLNDQYIGNMEQLRY